MKTKKAGQSQIETKQERNTKREDYYDSIGNYLTFLTEQVELLNQASNLDNLPTLSWTFVEMRKKIDKITALTNQLRELDEKAAVKAA